MKHFILITALIFSGVVSFSQTQYDVSYDTKHPGVKILKGIINKGQKKP